MGANIIKFPPDIFSKYLAFLNDFIRQNKEYYEIFIDREANEVIIIEHDNHFYTSISFKNDGLHLLIPHAFKQFTSQATP